MRRLIAVVLLVIGVFYCGELDSYVVATPVRVVLFVDTERVEPVEPAPTSTDVEAEAALKDPPKAISLHPNAGDEQGTIVDNAGEPLKVVANGRSWKQALKAGVSLAAAALPFLRDGASQMVTKVVEKAIEWLFT